MGPGVWAGAKKAIEDAPGNVIYATKTRSLPPKVGKESHFSAVYLKILVLFVMVVAICARFLCEKQADITAT